MLQHHIQKTIVYELAFVEQARFSELKPDSVESKLFDYHLKLVVKAGYVKKDDQGTYSLTAEGRKLGFNVHKDILSANDKAYSIILLAIRQGKGGPWLLGTRKTHPLINKVGMVHATPIAGTDSLETAKQECQVKTGLVCNFEFRGSGYFTNYVDDELESYVHFTFLSCTDPSGDLMANDPNMEYAWVDQPDFESENMIPNTKLLASKLDSKQLFFAEETYRKPAQK